MDRPLSRTMTLLRLLPRHGEAGFTLVEVVVSLSILALSLSLLFYVISNAVVQTGRAENAAQAASLAQSLLAEAGTSTPLQKGLLAGQSGNGLRWRLHMEPYIGTSDLQQVPVGAYRVTAEVLWNDAGDDRSLALSTLRLGPAGAAR